MTILEINNDLRKSKYLGLPSLIDRSIKLVFNFIKRKILAKKERSSKHFSIAGKTIVVKNMAQLIPSYCMSCFLIPQSLCKKIERMMNKVQHNFYEDDIQLIL